MINSKDELWTELVKNHGMVKLPSCMVLINGLAVDDIFRYIYVSGIDHLNDDDSSEDKDVYEFCDSCKSVIATMPIDELEEFEVLFEYDDDGFIIN